VSVAYRPGSSAGFAGAAAFGFAVAGFAVAGFDACGFAAGVVCAVRAAAPSSRRLAGRKTRKILIYCQLILE
jgi:hypothetical protein